MLCEFLEKEKLRPVKIQKKQIDIKQLIEHIVQMVKKNFLKTF